jgi:hypothetical protein
MQYKNIPPPFPHVIRKISAQTQMLTGDAKMFLKLKTLVLCELLQKPTRLK